MEHLNEDILAPLKESWYEAKKYMDEENAATEP